MWDAELADRAVDQIAGHRDEIGAQAVDRIDDGIDIALSDCRTDMHVADLRDGEPDQCGGRPCSGTSTFTIRRGRVR